MTKTNAEHQKQHRDKIKKQDREIGMYLLELRTHVPSETEKINELLRAKRFRNLIVGL